MLMIISAVIPLTCLMLGIFMIADARSTKSDKEIQLAKSERAVVIENYKARGAVLHPICYERGEEIYCWSELTNINAIGWRSESLYINTYTDGR